MHKKFNDKIVIWLGFFVIICGVVIYYSNNIVMVSTVDKTNSDNKNIPVKTTVKTTVSTTPSPMTYNVNIENFNFNKASINVKKGDTVVWTNKDSTVHTVSGIKGGPNSGAIQPGNSYSYTYTTGGSWGYSCHYHPSMSGVVIVQ